MTVMRSKFLLEDLTVVGKADTPHFGMGGTGSANQGDGRDETAA